MKNNRRYINFDIGDYSYGEPAVLFSNSGAKLTIRKFVSIADGVTILLGGEHRLDWVTTYPLMRFFPELSNIPGHPTSKGDVFIGNDVWIGRGAFISSGVTIGDGAVIGAHAVVTKDVAPYSITAGNPAVHIRSRFSHDRIKKLLELKWWDWPEEKILHNANYLLSNEVDQLITNTLEEGLY